MEEYKAQGGVVGKRRQDKKDAKDGKKSRRTDPNRPKKPATAYWIWLAENRPSLQEEVGNNASKVTKLGGERWRAMSENDKKSFEARAVVLKAEYSKAMEEYRRNHGAVMDEEHEDGEEQN